jgi:NADH-quinone oxidoreductase subunit M
MNNTLLLLLLIPLVGSFFVAFGSRKPLNAGKVALLISTATFLLSLVMLKQFVTNGITGGFDKTLTYSIPFLPQIGSSFTLGLDGISLWLVLLTNLLTPLAIWQSFFSIKIQPRTYYGLMLLMQMGMTGVFLSTDLLWFYMFFEFTLVPLFLVIGIWGGANKIQAAFKLFIYTMAGGVLTFGGLLFIVWTHANQTGGALTFDIQTLYATDFGIGNTQIWVFLALFAGFAVKVPLFPFHTWLPLAHTEAPTAGSVILAGVLLKLGTYGFLRIVLPILPEASDQLAPMIAVLSLVGLVYGALAAWVQPDIKKLVAYSSVSHLGVCMLGLFTFNSEGLSGSLLYMINHGISTGALFLIIGMVYDRYHTRAFSELGGLAKPMPIMAFFMIFFSMSSVGLPGLNGFISEFVIFVATFNSTVLGPWYAMIAVSGVILSAIYMLYLCQHMIFGPFKAPEVVHHEGDEVLPEDLSPREWGLLLPLAVLVLALGIYPKIYFNTTNAAIDQLNTTIIVKRDAIQALIKNAEQAPVALVETVTKFN